ncbi:MAG: SDR family NAD(P)-dependent oxidoreductase [Lentisphaerae bacterium]|nr:SDR family NAD(P)-dependent oxidoreductase [Lentisphaerota bacterium]MCP4101522.1 SDR family NAD(P)-dependent oxidoreductase [Lentisphaerota bacterium]
MSLSVIAELSNLYGANPEFVLAGGGNTSCKDEKFIYVKPSGVSLAAIKPEDFIKMERSKVKAVFNLGKFNSDSEREDAVKNTLLAAKADGSVRRPSVETPLHEILPYKYVVHTHPALINGMTCGKDGQKLCEEFFPEAVWIEYTDPGFILADIVARKSAEYEAAKGAAPKVIFLQNHGVFVAADTADEINALYDGIMDLLKDFCAARDVSTELSFGKIDGECVYQHAPELRTLLSEDGKPYSVISLPPFEIASGPFSPDHIVYAKSFSLETADISSETVAAFEKANGYKARVVSVPGKAVFCVADTLGNAENVAALAKDAALVRQFTTVFGGENYLSDAARLFIENWESESYRKKIAAGAGLGRLHGKVAVVTGGAQGFGFGIAQELAAEGAVTVIADLNLEGAAKAADEIKQITGKNNAFAVEVNISSEEAVEKMCRDIVSKVGGMDLFVANAGVLKTGSVKELDKKDWDFVTNVNYSGYFLCVKHVAQVMSRQNKYTDCWSDIVQVNSKSGLTGSNRNGAYAGSKFGTIGLTQSFALELIDDHIKVNSVCPGNYFDGPLWSDPERGLFVQYLSSNKVPGAKTVEDVKRFYESKIPMDRGCFPKDVAKAIMYAVEQQYETGQAIPVTGGQVMLN